MITSDTERLLNRILKNDMVNILQTFGIVRNNFAMKKLRWSVIICGWTRCPSAETSFTIRGETIEAVPPTGWWSGRTEPLYWTGRRFRPRKNPTKQTTDCQVPPATVAHRDAQRPGLGGAAVQGVPLPAGQTPATPHPWSPAPRRAEVMNPWSNTRIQDRRRHLWKRGWWNGRRRTRSCRFLWSHSTPERVRQWIIVKMQTVHSALNGENVP